MTTPCAKWDSLRGPGLLLAWRNGSKRTQQEVADLIGCDLAKYNAYENGRERPGLDYAVAIETATRGRVKPSDWVVGIQHTKSKAG